MGGPGPCGPRWHLWAPPAPSEANGGPRAGSWAGVLVAKMATVQIYILFHMTNVASSKPQFVKIPVFTKRTFQIVENAVFTKPPVRENLEMKTCVEKCGS
jgi:hypothetical protein